MFGDRLKREYQKIKQSHFFGTRVENLILAVLLCGLLWTLFSHFVPTKAQDSAAVAAEEEVFEMDEYLPAGFVLFPMEFENQESLDPLIGSFAILNIYQTQTDGMGKGRLVAKNVKVLRAPQNPQTLAALIPENQVAALMQTSGGFYGVLQRKNSDLAFEQAQAHKKAHTIRIESFEAEPSGGTQ